MRTVTAKSVWDGSDSIRWYERVVVRAADIDAVVVATIPFCYVMQACRSARAFVLVQLYWLGFCDDKGKLTLHRSQEWKRRIRIIREREYQRGFGDGHRAAWADLSAEYEREFGRKLWDEEATA